MFNAKSDGEGGGNDEQKPAGQGGEKEKKGGGAPGRGEGINTRPSGIDAAANRSV